MVVTDVLARNVATRGTHPFILHAGRSLTYRAFERLTNQLANALKALAVKPGDRVTLALGNSIEYVIAAFGILKTGAILHPIDPELDPGGLADILTHAEPRAIITSDESLEHLRAAGCPAIHSAIVAVFASEHRFAPAHAFSSLGTSPPGVIAPAAKDREWRSVVSLDEMLATSPESRPGVRVGATDPALLVYAPDWKRQWKGRLFTHGSTTGEARQFIEALAITCDDVILTVSPLCQMEAWSAVQTAIHAGATAAYPVVFDASTFWPLVYETRATVLYTLGMILSLLLGRRPSDRESQSTLRLVFGVGSAPLSEEVMLRFGVEHVADCFAPSNTGVVAITPTGSTPPAGSSGLPVDGVRILILGEDGKELPPRAVGTIAVQSSQQPLTYRGAANEAPQEVPAGWVLTSAHGYVDEEGWLYLMNEGDTPGAGTTV